jgi:hypothetical protein
LRLAEVERIKPFIDLEPHGGGGRGRPQEPV